MDTDPITPAFEYTLVAHYGEVLRGVRAGDAYLFGDLGCRKLLVPKGIYDLKALGVCEALADICMYLVDFFWYRVFLVHRGLFLFLII